MRKIGNIYKITLPTPLPGLKEVNAYLIEAGDEAILIDSGIHTRESIERLTDEITSRGYHFNNIRMIIATHLHIDHVGGAAYLKKEFGASIGMGIDECRFVRYMVEDTIDSIERFGKIMFDAGVPREILDNLVRIHPGSSNINVYKEITCDRRIKDGEILKLGEDSLITIDTPGHSIQHICLYNPLKRILLTGDHILPYITPNIRVPIYGDPLKEYLESLDKVYTLDVDYYLPGHGEISKGLRKRIDEIRCHHFNRLLEILEILSEKSYTGYEVASKMKWDIKIPWEDFPPIQIYFAVGEAIAHLNYLISKKLVKFTKDGDLIKYTSISYKDNDIETLKRDICKSV